MYGNACSPQATSTPGVAAASAACFGITAKAVARNCSVNDASLARRVKLFRKRVGLVRTHISFIVSSRLLGGGYHALSTTHSRFKSGVTSAIRDGSQCVKSTFVLVFYLYESLAGLLNSTRERSQVGVSAHS